MRASGILLPVFSLPGKYGIGCFSEEAYRFIDFLKEAGQKYWQILPVGPTGCGDSPYQSFSAFAGNPYFLSPGVLVQEGLLTQEEAETASGCGEGWKQQEQSKDVCRCPVLTASDGSEGRKQKEPSNDSCRCPVLKASDGSEGREQQADSLLPDTEASGIDYAWLYETRLRLLRKAYVRWKETQNSRKDPEDGISLEAFLQENDTWLPDYALFIALKESHGGAGFQSWEEPLRLRQEGVMEAARQDLEDEIGFHFFLQFQFERQWRKLKAYANANGISIIGDIPIYVPADSADVWSHPELFQLREDGSCLAVAGCPPDGFSATGQLWGNPLYDWQAHAESGYDWWIRRMRRCRSLFDVVRIDHFRGFDQYYAIPADRADARIGRWEDGPGIRLFQAFEKELPGLSIIAEDLGYITDSVRELVRKTGYPNMKVLEFAFDSRDSSGREAYLPYHYEKNCVVYTGTHDNETLMGWLDSILPQERAEVCAYLGLAGGDWDLNREHCGAGYGGKEEDPAQEEGKPALCRETAEDRKPERLKNRQEPGERSELEQLKNRQGPGERSQPEQLKNLQEQGDRSETDQLMDRQEPGRRSETDQLKDRQKPGRRSETERLARGLVRAAMSSVGDLCVIPMQDWLLLGNEARINTPSTASGNWRWRMREKDADSALAAQIRKMTLLYGRV